MMGDLLLHNGMLDSGFASNTMTRKVMEQLNLKTTRPYRNVCAMDSREVDVVGIILNQQMRLAKYPDIHIAMDILVIDVLDKWGMLLSRKWAATLGGWIQMDWTYAAIPASEDSWLKLCNEKEKKYHVENPKKPLNEYVYNIDDIGIYTWYSTFLAALKEKIKDEKVDEIWRMNFDDAHSRDGKGAGVVITSPKGKTFNFAYRLELEETNC